MTRTPPTTYPLITLELPLEILFGLISFTPKPLCPLGQGPLVKEALIAQHLTEMCRKATASAFESCCHGDKTQERVQTLGLRHRQEDLRGS